MDAFGPPPALLLVGVFAFILLVLGCIVARRFQLITRPGSFECLLYDDKKDAWRTGIMTYDHQQLDWYRLLSLAPGASLSWPRRSLLMNAMKPAEEEVALGLGSQYMVIDIGSETGELRLALPQDACFGLSSWLESGPPGGLKEFE